MSRNEETVDQLDTEFDLNLREIKPYVHENPNSKDCKLWIKKLCDGSSRGRDIKALKVRNSYLRLLLQMLKRGHLEAPFTVKPKPGSLSTLPAYLCIYYEDDPRRLREENKLDSHDWSIEELSPDNTLTLSLLSTGSPPGRTYRRSLRQKTPPQPTTSSPLKPSATPYDGGGAGRLGVDASSSDSDLEAGVNSWNLGVENPPYLRENTVSFSPDDESNSGKGLSTVDDADAHLKLRRKMEMKVLEAKHQEEKLKMEQRQDKVIEDILLRKNGEMNQMKGSYRAKMQELEERNHELEMRVQRTIQDSQVIQQSQDLQIAELKKTLDQSCLKEELERKLRSAEAQFDQQKMELQKKQTKRMEDLVKETNVRLAEVDSMYEAQFRSAEDAASDLELQLKQKSLEIEKVNTLMTQEKAQLEIRMASLEVELQGAIHRVQVVQKEKEKQKETYEEMLKRNQTKHDNETSRLHQMHTLSESKDSERREVLEKTIADLQQQLLDADFKSQEEMEKLRVTCEKTVSAIQSEAEEERAAARREMAKLEEALREKTERMNRELEKQRKKILLSAEKFKIEMESREKEFSQQLEDLRGSTEQQMAEQRSQFEQARTRQREQHCVEKDSLVQERQREVSTLEKEARAALRRHQERTQELRKRDGQRILHLESELSSVREDLEVNRIQHEQQLAEMTVRHEEEKQRVLLDKETAMERQRLDMEHMCNDLERRHQEDVHAMKEASSSRSRRVEQECSQKMATSAQVVADLRTSVCQSKEESIRAQEAMKRRLEDAHVRWDHERNLLIQNHQALQENVERLEKQLSLSENKLLSKELETEEKVTLVRLEYAEKMEALIPAEIQNELENTIVALKSQVDLLQRRNSVLQEDLDACRGDPQ